MYKAKSFQMQEVVSNLCMITSELENGISDAEYVCEHIAKSAHEDQILYNELCTQINPKEGKIVDTLTQLISVENTMINLIEEIISVAETQLQVSASMAQTANSKKLRESQLSFDDEFDQENRSSTVPPLWDHNSKYQGIEVHKFLQINDHIDRVCQCSQLLVRIKRAIIADKEDEDFSFNNSSDDDSFAEQFMDRHCRRKISPEASVEKLCNAYDATLPNFEKAIMTINKLLVHP